jgi:Na+-transporting NADH:ubiquinone oxidoreductase subunit NqrC
VKPGSLSDKLTQVDGISGGTFTSVGVQEMLKRTFYVYYKHFNENKLETANL